MNSILVIDILAGVTATELITLHRNESNLKDFINMICIGSLIPNALPLWLTSPAWVTDRMTLPRQAKPTTLSVRTPMSSAICGRKAATKSAAAVFTTVSKSASRLKETYMGSPATTAMKVENTFISQWRHIDGSVQDCSNSSALVMELLQSCAKSSTWSLSTPVF